MIGVPDESSLSFVKSENARRYLRELPRYEKQSLLEKFPTVPPLALDLVENMLKFDPAKRITGIFTFIDPVVFIKPMLIHVVVLM